MTLLGRLGSMLFGTRLRSVERPTRVRLTGRLRSPNLVSGILTPQRGALVCLMVGDLREERRSNGDSLTTVLVFDEVGQMVVGEQIVIETEDGLVELDARQLQVGFPALAAGSAVILDRRLPEPLQTLVERHRSTLESAMLAYHEMALGDGDAVSLDAIVSPQPSAAFGEQRPRRWQARPELGPVVLQDLSLESPALVAASGRTASYVGALMFFAACAVVALAVWSGLPKERRAASSPTPTSSSARVRLSDTEGREFSANCAPIEPCDIVQLSGPRDPSKPRTFLLQLETHVVGVGMAPVRSKRSPTGTEEVSTPDPSDFRALACADRADCPAGEDIGCYRGLCVRPAVPLDAHDVTMLCEAGRGIAGPSNPDADEAFRALPCSPPHCRLPRSCRQP